MSRRKERPDMKISRILAAGTIAALFACAGPSPATPPAGAPNAMRPAPSASAETAAEAYCQKTGGKVQILNSWYTTPAGKQARLSASAPFCKYTAKDKSFIYVDVETLYSTKPTEAALAYYAQIKENAACRKYLNDPAVCYCRQQLIGSDFFLQGGSWVPAGTVPNGNNRSPFCVFSDFSAIDSWGLTYHSAGIVRGMDLSKVLRYKP
jgi:hypothetical protein